LTCMQHKRFLVGIIAVFSVVAIVISLPIFFWNVRRPRFSLEDKVESFHVRYESGDNMTIYPSTSEGIALLSGSQNYMSNIYAQLMWATSDEEVAYARNSTQYVEVKLKNTYNFTFYVRLSTVDRVENANRILLFLSGSHRGTILFAREENEATAYGGSYVVESGVSEFQELVNGFQIK
jgi:hypothetical protein